MPDGYPVQFSVSYPDRELNRLTTVFRIFVGDPDPDRHRCARRTGRLVRLSGRMNWCFAAGAGGLLFFPPLLMILFRREVPALVVRLEPPADAVLGRVGVYLGVDGRQYPSTDEEQSVKLDFPYPDAQNGLNRWLPLVKWLLAIPHYIILVFLSLAAHRLRDRGLVRDSLHRPLPAGPLRLRRGSLPLVEPGDRVRVRPRDGRIPAVQPQRITADRRAMRRRPIGQILVEKGEISEVDLRRRSRSRSVPGGGWARS